MIETRKAVGWFLLGLLLTTALVNAMGFASPLWAIATNADPRTANADTRALWDAGQAMVPWLSLVFVVAVWHLSLAVSSVVGRVALRLLGLLLAVSFVGPAVLPVAEHSLLHPIFGFVQFLTLFVCTFLVWRNLRAAS